MTGFSPARPTVIPATRGACLLFWSTGTGVESSLKVAGASVDANCDQTSTRDTEHRGTTQKVRGDETIQPTTFTKKKTAGRFNSCSKRRWTIEPSNLAFCEWPFSPSSNQPMRILKIIERKSLFWESSGFFWDVPFSGLKKINVCSEII
jgi:hypothetical protein